MVGMDKEKGKIEIELYYIPLRSIPQPSFNKAIGHPANIRKIIFGHRPLLLQEHD